MILLVIVHCWKSIHKKIWQFLFENIIQNTVDCSSCLTFTLQTEHKIGSLNLEQPLFSSDFLQLTLWLLAIQDAQKLGYRGNQFINHLKLVVFLNSTV